MEEKISEALVNKATPVILGKMGSGFLQKSPEIIQALTPVLARKEAMVIKVAEAVAPFLGSATDRFMRYLQEVNELAIQTKKSDYEFIATIICNDSMTFEQKKDMVVTAKEEIRKDKKQKYDFWKSITKIGGTVAVAMGAVLITIPKFLEIHYDYKKDYIKEKGKLDRLNAKEKGKLDRINAKKRK